MYPPDPLQKVISKFPDVALVPTPEKFVREPSAQIKVPPAKLREVSKFLKENSDLAFDMPNNMTAVDYLKENIFELVYFLYSTKKKQGLVMKSQIARDVAEIDSVSDIWEGLDWQEREVFDLFGIKFKGHPNLKRIMMWEGFPGYPLRKDYVHTTDKYDSGLEVGTPGLDEKGLPIKKV